MLTGTGGTMPYVWSLAAGSLPPGLNPQPRGIDRRDQRQGHDARDVCVHGARDGQPVARGDGDEGVVDYGNEINNLVGATGATRSRATRISMP
jgi:hypothetical protein